jgi:hypothetical protein
VDWKGRGWEARGTIEKTVDLSRAAVLLLPGSGDGGGGERRAKGGTGGRGEGRERQTQRGQTTVSVALMGDAGGSKGEEIDGRGAWVGGGVGGKSVRENGRNYFDSYVDVPKGQKGMKPRYFVPGTGGKRRGAEEKKGIAGGGQGGESGGMGAEIFGQRKRLLGVYADAADIAGGLGGGCGGTGAEMLGQRERLQGVYADAANGKELWKLKKAARLNNSARKDLRLNLPTYTPEHRHTATSLSKNRNKPAAITPNIGLPAMDNREIDGVVGRRVWGGAGDEVLLGDEKKAVYYDMMAEEEAERLRLERKEQEESEDTAAVLIQCAVRAKIARILLNLQRERKEDDEWIARIEVGEQERIARLLARDDLGDPLGDPQGEDLEMLTKVRDIYSGADSQPLLRPQTGGGVRGDPAVSAYDMQVLIDEGQSLLCTLAERDTEVETMEVEGLLSSLQRSSTPLAHAIRSHVRRPSPPEALDVSEALIQQNPKLCTN